MPDLQSRERSIFLKALDLDSPSELDAFLRKACGSDQALRCNIESLLRAHQQRDDVFDITQDIPAAEFEAGTKIGPYNLREKIGEGGFGVVYVAEQLKPVRRKVAIKVIKPGMDSKEVVARFEAERQALALMEHANIARVLDAGATEQGRPYFVMELVHGLPITEFCDKNKLSTTKRLELFLDVCRAVQHAHQKGIIHRDLKPNNVMVTLRDGKPVPKVIDFGVSKALSQQLTEKTIYTAYGQVVGTPQYMSPEQAEMSEIGLDTRSDIYSLGVLLYELLAGATPVDPVRLRSSGYAEMMRIIREEDPPRPSNKVSTMGEEATAIAESRLTDLKALSRMLSGELDWIVMKALDKDRDRRYETANHFATDVQRFLNDEAVQACPPSIAYRLKKTFSRHHLSITIAASLALLLCLGLVGTSIGMVRAQRAENDAQVEKQNALEEKEKANKAEAKAWENAEQARAAEERAKQQRDASNYNHYRVSMNQGAHATKLPRSLRRIEMLTEPWESSPLRGWEWYYLRSRLFQNPRILQLPEGTGHVFEGSGSADKSRLAAVVRDRLVCIWDINSGQLLHSRLSVDDVKAVTWYADSRQLVLAIANRSGDDHSILLWDPESDGLTTVATRVKHAGFLRCSPDGQYIASMDLDGSQIVDLTSRDITMVETLPTKVDWSPDGTRLASVSPPEPGISIWDSAAAELIATFDDRTWFGSKWSPDGKRVAARNFYDICIWDVDERRVLCDLRGHLAYVSALAWNVDGTKLASAAGDGTIRLWNTQSGEELRVYQGHFGPIGGIYLVAWTPEEDQLISAGKDGLIKFWPVAEEPQLTGPVAEPRTRLTSAWSRDPKWQLLVLADESGIIDIWDAETRERLHRLTAEAAGVRNVTLSPDGKYLACGNERGTIQVWDLRTGKPRHEHEFRVSDSPITWVSWSPLGDNIAFADRKGRVELWDVLQPRHLETILVSENERHDALAWSPDGKHLAIGQLGGRATIWNAAGGELTTLPGHDKNDGWQVNCLSWSPDNLYLAGCSDRSVIVWDVEQQSKAFVLSGHAIGVRWVAWSPDGTRIATAGHDTTVEVWDAQKGELMITLHGHSYPIVSVEWNHDGTCLVSTSQDGKVQIWDARKGYDPQIIELTTGSLESK